MNDVVARILELARGGQRHLIAIAGPPATGKSTYAAKLAEALTEAGRVAVEVPMDGFHLDNAILDARGIRARKGTPESFDLAGFTRLAQTLGNREEVIFPLFDRERDLAIAGAGVISQDCDLAILEGNYLLFDQPGWDALPAYWSLSIWLETARETLAARLKDRWVELGLNPEELRQKLELNDLPNADLVLDHQLPADITVSSEAHSL